MAFPRGDPVEEIDRLITQHRDDQIAWQHNLDQAADAERNALGAMQAAQDLQRRSAEAIELDAEEINRLLAERLVYVPAQRQGE